eukprot:GGOE01008142.1.p1 GENE.GGOE01008142.1~~GGOE01008142.1.p1  ORF type:complete len:706 (+),score=191.03 GGOE01008142.1:138-2120(+)
MTEASHISKLWCAVQLALCLLWFFFTALRYRLFWRPSLAAFVPEPVPFLAITAVFFSNYVARWRPYTHFLVYAGSLIIVGFLSWKVHFHVVQEMLLAQSLSIKAVYAAVQDNANALAQLQMYVNQEESRKALTLLAVQMLVQFNVLQFLGLGLGTALVYLSFPVALFTTAFASPVVADAIIEICIISTIIALTTLSSSLQVSRMQRERFATAHTLQLTLEREAATSLRLANHERQMKEAAIEADTILNHMLKNIMADAAGCIWLYVASIPGTLPADLEQALGCLDRGMRWCRHRQALIRLAAGTYRLSRVPVSLRSFGEALANGRALNCKFVDDFLLLDPLLCDILLDNAINNALRHGDTSREPVAFSMALELLDECAADLTFTVTNCCKPSKPKVTPEFVQSVLRGEMMMEPGNSLSDHLGLQHVFMAAEAHGIRLTLQQEGDVVVLQATLTAQRENRIVRDTVQGVQSLSTEATLHGLRILCLDDSEVARRLLKSTLQRDLPSCTVEVFGSNSQEVRGFMDAVLDHGDMILIDNHLVYEDAQFTGTQLISELFSAGYAGYVCVRSANMSPEDQAQYVASGAHCCLGKDVRPKEMVGTLNATYREHRHRASVRGRAQQQDDSLSRTGSGEVFLQMALEGGSSADHSSWSKSLFPFGVTV